MSYENPLEEFRGPLEAIITQVRENEKSIFDFCLKELAVDFQEKMPPNIREGATFIAGLSHLMYLKAVKLIPEETCEPEDEIEELTLFDLSEYEVFKKAAETFTEKEREQERHFWRKPDFEVVEPVKKKLPPPISLDAFSQIFQEILEEAKKRKMTINEDSYSVYDMLQVIRKKTKNSRMLFSELFSSEKPKMLLIVSFLAVLEMMKHGELLLYLENEILYFERI